MLQLHPLEPAPARCALIGTFILPRHPHHLESNWLIEGICEPLGVPCDALVGARDCHRHALLRIAVHVWPDGPVGWVSLCARHVEQHRAEARLRVRA